MGAPAKDAQPTSASQRQAKKIQFPNETKTSKLRAAKAAGTAPGSVTGSATHVTEKYQGGGGRGTNADKVPPPVPGQHMRQQSEKMPHLEAVDRLEVICATEPNDCSDDLRVFDFQDEEPNASDELLVDNLTPKATGVGRRKSYSNHFAFSGKDPAKGVLAVRVQVRGGRRHSRWLAKFSYLMRTSYERTSRYELGLILLSQYYWFYLPALGRERAAPVDSSSFHRALCNTVHQLENI